MNVQIIAFQLIISLIVAVVDGKQIEGRTGTILLLLLLLLQADFLLNAFLFKVIFSHKHFVDMMCSEFEF